MAVYYNDIEAGILTENYPGAGYASEELLARLSALQLKAHLFGHIYTQHGVEVIDGAIFSNGAIMNSNYDDLNAPQITII